MVLIPEMGVRAQFVLQSYLEVGETNVSEGIYLKNGYRGQYHYDRFLLEAGLLAELNRSNTVRISGVELAVSRDIKLKQFPTTIKAFYLMNIVSEYFYESNAGLTLDLKGWNHLGLSVGNNLKTFTYTSLAMDEFQLSATNRRFTEYFNLIYDLTAYLKPIGNEWNLGISLTNIDQYVLNQSTNPMFILGSNFSIKPGLTMNVDIGYKRAGIMNISAHHFGYFVRTGISWSP